MNRDHPQERERENRKIQPIWQQIQCEQLNDQSPDTLCLQRVQLTQRLEGAAWVKAEIEVGELGQMWLQGKREVK